MKEKSLLLIDAVINLALGVLLLFSPAQVAEFLGVPPITPRIYPSPVRPRALFRSISRARPIPNNTAPKMLGLGGAVTINLSGGIVLAGWLLFGGLSLPVRGLLFLWGLVLLLVGISTAELVSRLR